MTDSIRFSPPQDFRHTVRQDDGTHSLIGLRLTDGVLALPSGCGGCGTPSACRPPRQSRSIADRRSRRGAGRSSAPSGRSPATPRPAPPLRGRRPAPRRSECAWACSWAWEPSSPRWVSGNDVRLHRIFQRGVKRGMDVADHGVRELMIHLGMLVDAPPPFLGGGTSAGRPAER